MLDETVEQLAPAFRLAAVESRCEFVQVVGQVCPADRSLERTQQPALKKGDHQMHVRHQFDNILALLSDDGGLTLVVLLFQSLVALPAAGVNCAARLDRIHDEGVQAVGRSVLDGTQPDAANAFALNGDYNQGLVTSTTAGDANRP